MHNSSIQKKMDRQPVHLPKSQVLFSQIPSVVQPVNHIPYIILKSVHYLTRRCTPACHADDQKQLGGKCCTQQKHPYFFHCALSFDGVYALLSVYYNDPVGQLACPFCTGKGCFLLFLLFSESRNAKTAPASCYGNRDGSFALFVLFQALTQLLAGVLDSSLGGCQNYRAFGIIYLPTVSHLT